MKLLFYNESTNSLDRVREARKILSLIESIFNSGSTGEVLLYLLDRGAATAWLLQVDLELPEATVYRTLKRLRSMDLVVDAIKVHNIKGSRGGPRPIVWALQGAHTEDVARAMRDHHRALSPKYRVAEQFVQTVIEPYLKRNTQVNGIDYKQIFNFVSEEETPFHIGDIAELAATILHDQGVKVWR